MLRTYRVPLLMLGIFSLGLTGVFGQVSTEPPASPHSVAQPDDVIGQAKKACEDIIEKLGKAKEEQEARADPSTPEAIEEMIKQAEAETAEKYRQQAADPADPVPVPLTIDERRTVAKQASDQLLALRKAADKYAEDGKKALEKANIVRAQELLKRAEETEEELKRVGADIAAIGRSPPATDSRLPGRRVRPQIKFGDWSTRRLLLGMAAGGPDTQQKAFKGSEKKGAREEALKPVPGMEFFKGPPAAATPRPSQDIRAYDRERALITSADGRQVSIKPLIDAGKKLNLPAFRDPVVKVQPPVPRAAPVERFSPALLRAVAEKRDELRKVGGVALDVTFQHLALVGVPDMRVAGPATVVENPVIISLRALEERARPYGSSQDRWELLPEEIRYPGNIDRVVGFVLSPEDQDVLVIGTPAKHDRNRIDIDTFIVSISVVWKQGLVPGASLDPLPHNFGGPQYPRVINVPADSTIAKIMLDADYEMKLITLGQRRLHDPMFRPMDVLIAEAGEVRDGASRFWFYPRSLSKNTVRLSRTGRTVLFETQLDVLTEELTVRNGTLTGTGATDDNIARRVAELFTAVLPKLELSDTPQPLGIFRRLHGVTDVVTLCTLLRMLGVDYPILDSMISLPYRPLRGIDRIPAHYKGLTVAVSRAGASAISFLSGGVDIRPRTKRGSIDVYDDLVTRSLEQAADQLRAKGVLYHQLSLTFLLPKQEISTDAKVQPLLLKAARAFESGKYALAAETYREILSTDPLNVDALLDLAASQSLLSLHSEARRTLDKATALAPNDDRVRLMAMDIDRRANPNWDRSSVDKSVLKSLSDEYVSRAYGAMHASRTQDAKRFADEAISIWAENGDAYLVRFWLAKEQSLQVARTEINRAIRLYRQQRGDGGRTRTAQGRLAMALSLSASLRIESLRARIARIQAAGEQSIEIRTFLDDARRAAEEAQEASTLDPSLALAFSTEVLARSMRLAIMRENQRGDIPVFDPLPAKRLADEAVRRFPDFPLAHASRALLSMVTHDYLSAERDLSTAISLDPTLGEAFLDRSLARSKLGQCHLARQDLQRAKALKVTVLGEEEREISQCR